MIICPNTGDECSKLVKPITKSAFLMITYPNEEIDNKDNVKEINEIKNTIFDTFGKNGYSVLYAGNRKGRNLFCKICEQIQSVPIGLIVYTEGTPSRSLPNIFFELGVMSIWGKELILLKDYKTEQPSDLIGLEWTYFKNVTDLKKQLSDIIKQYPETARNLIKVADYFYENNLDYEKAINYYKRAYLLCPNDEVLKNLEEILKKLDTIDKGNKYYALSLRLKENLKFFLSSV